MVARIEELTDAQRATIPGWVEQWIAVGLRTGSLSQEEWRRVDAAARALYRFAGLSEPRVVHRVASPLAGAVAACVAAEVAQTRGVAKGVRSGIYSPIRSSVWSSVEASVEADVESGVSSGVGSSVESGVAEGVGSGVQSGVSSGVWLGVDAGGSGVGSGVQSGIHSPIRSSIRSGVRWSVESGISSGVQSGIWSGVYSGVEWGIWSGVYSGISLSGVESGISSGASLEADMLASWADWLHDPIRRGLKHARVGWSAQYMAGNLWCAWNAWASWFRVVGRLDLPGDLWDRVDADNTLMLAGPSWWYAGHCIISDRPTVLHVENVAGVNRLHCADGPAIAWADGWGIYSWHGTRVPADLIEGRWDVTRILSEQNVEVRRAAIEVMGWGTFIAAAGLARVGESMPDPGNPGQSLTLYDLPEQIYGEPVRVLLCVNASRERDGSRRRYGLTVPANIRDPLTAAAWTFGVDATAYRTLARAT